MSKDASGSARGARQSQAFVLNTTEAERDAEYPNIQVKLLNKMFRDGQYQKETKDTLKRYQEDMFDYINDGLRKGGEVGRFAAVIDQAMLPLPQNMTLRRGVRTFDDDPNHASYNFVNDLYAAHANGTIAGTRFQDKGFVSTSIDTPIFSADTSSSKGIAGMLSSIRNATRPQKKVDFVIRAKKGSLAAVPPRNTAQASENEVLLAQGVLHFEFLHPAWKATH